MNAQSQQKKLNTLSEEVIKDVKNMFYYSGWKKTKILEEISAKHKDVNLSKVEVLVDNFKINN
jgi:hypothetical protein